MAHPHDHDHAHSHGFDDDRPLGERLRSVSDRRVLAGTVLAIAVLTVVGLLALWPGEVDPVTTLEGETFLGERVHATVRDVTTADCSFSSAPGEFVCDTVVFEVTSGSPDGATDQLELPIGSGAIRLHEGDDIILSYAFDAPPGARFQFQDFERSIPMALLVVLFVVVVVAFARWRGVFALLGVGISLLVLGAFVLPALLEGSSPLLVALVGTSAVALPALYLAHGPSERTSVAVIGTVASLLLTCLLGLAFVEVTQLTGLASEEASFLRAFGGDLDFSGLLLAGMVIGALGVLDDVTVTQVSAVWELSSSRADASARELYRAGTRIGRDHIASTVNTLVLAYAGASLPLLLLFVTSGQRFGHVITGEAIAAEVVRALVGSIGLVASVPITTMLAALVVTRDRPVAPRPRRPRPEPEPEPAVEPAAARWEDFGPAGDEG